jgi:predicted DsbA family dithiol-disulfide isomerase
MSRITLDIWSDFVCPFCYLEAPVLDALRAEFGDALDIQWCAFELRPDPVPTLDPKGDYLREAWKNHVYPMAEERGMRLRLPPVQPRSRLAFEAELFAREHGLGDKMRMSLFQAFFEHGRDIGRISVLTSIGRAIGLNSARLRFALQNGDFTEAVHADRREAELLGIRGVPAMRLRSASGRQRLITGAQPVEALREQIVTLLAGEVRQPDFATTAVCRIRPEAALAQHA